MLKKIIIPVVSATGLALLSGCASQPTSYPSNFRASPVAKNTSRLAYTPKVNALYVLLDASSSTSATYDGDSSGATKFDVEKQTLYRLNKSIPANINLSTALKTFGSGFCAGTDQGLARHSTQTFQAGLDQAACASGGTPASSALAATEAALGGARGKTTLLIVSDGMQYPADTLEQAQALKNNYPNLCISSIWVGNEYDTAGQFVLQELSNIAQCGKSVNAADINSSSAMAGFVEGMLFTSMAVAAPVRAPVVATSTDDDGDGVNNRYDQCKNTPAGAKVNAQGCWSYNKVDFGFNNTEITPEYASLFDNAIYVLKQNPGMTVELTGHTDSTGPAAYNQGLSVRRAQAVKDHLVSNGIAADRLTVKGLGETAPIASNDTRDGRAENRRVGFEITGR